MTSSPASPLSPLNILQLQCCGSTSAMASAVTISPSFLPDRSCGKLELFAQNAVEDPLRNDPSHQRKLTCGRSSRVTKPGLGSLRRLKHHLRHYLRLVAFFHLLPRCLDDGFAYGVVDRKGPV